MYKDSKYVSNFLHLYDGKKDYFVIQPVKQY